jgi:hypothetical protein
MRCDPRMLLRCWQGSLPETPGMMGVSAVTIAESLSEDSTEDLIQILIVAEKALDGDPEYACLLRNRAFCRNQFAAAAIDCE